MKKYKCVLCGYIYDPEAGDYERNIPQGTPFEDLPDDWCCPECGAEKEYFEELDDYTTAVGKPVHMIVG